MFWANFLNGERIPGEKLFVLKGYGAIIGEKATWGGEKVFGSSPRRSSIWGIGGVGFHAPQKT